LSKDYTYLFDRGNMSIKKILVPLLFYFILFFTESYGADIHPPDDWRFFHRRGLKQFNARMYDYSHDSMVKALEKNPLSYESANILAKIALIKKERHRAIDYFEKSLSIKDEQPDVHNSLGLLLEYYGKSDEACSHFKRGYELDKKNLQVMINYSRFLRKKGENEEADRLFNLCHKSAISSSSPLVEQGKQISKERPGDAESFFKKAIELNPAHTEAYTALANLYRQEKKYDKSAEVMEKLKEVNTDYAPAYFYLGNLYYNTHLERERRKYWIFLAIKNIEEGLRLEPDNEDDLFHLAAIYRQIGKREKAAELEKRAVELMKKRDKPSR